MKLSVTATVLAVASFVSLPTPALCQETDPVVGVLCGEGTYLDKDTQECLPLSSSSSSEDPNVITLAGIFDTTTYTWGPQVFEATVKFINQGGWDVLPPNLRVTYQLENAACDETTAARQYWKLRTQNGNRPMHGLLGARCSGASVTLARLSGLERVPHLSPVSNAAQLSDAQEFPYFSRLVAPNNENGEVGALIAMLRKFGWERVTILATDTVYAKDTVNEFRRLWVGKHHGDGGNDWTGEVAYSDTIRINDDGTVNQESVRQALQGIPTDEPSVNSRIIFLAGHTQHAYPILKQAVEENFQKDTTWVGISSWVGRQEHPDFSWLPDVPGYLGVSIFRDRDETYHEFMEYLQDFQQSKGTPVWDELPVFAAEVVDGIRALTKALVDTGDRRDGDAVVKALRQLEFAGVSGQVKFTENGDRRDPQYSILNAQVGSSDGKFITWTDIGTTGTTIGSADLVTGFESVCWAERGCGLSSPPPDSDPIPEDKGGAELWAIILIVALGLMSLGIAFVHWRNWIELKKWRSSVVGMRTAHCKYVPTRQGSDIDLEKAKNGTLTVTPLPTVKWMWKETLEFVDDHDPNEVYGDPRDCWILYDKYASKTLEDAFQNKSKRVSPLEGYEVNISKMEQTKTATGFTRKVQRILETPTAADYSIDSTEIDLSEVEFGELPDDLEGEPCIVLVEGDIVKISKQRKDGWAFGTKLHHADEAVAQQLISISLDGADEKESNLFVDSGWFHLDMTRVPSAEDLEPMKKKIGDAGALAPPSHWDSVVDPSVVQMHELRAGDAERTAVENAFLSTLRPPYFDKTVKIVKVERVQNLSMWQSYVVKRQTMCYRETGHSGNGDDDEAQKKALQRFEKKWLFHGSNQEVMDKILQQGFNRSFAGKNATAYGKGVYFARDASYSANPLYAEPDRSGNQYMMACRVAVGEYCRGKHDARTPDIRNSKTHTLYDSTIGTTNCPLSDPSIYVTYHDAQAYPEYLITFRAK